MKQMSLHRLFFLLIVLIIQQNTASAMDCPGCNKRFSRSPNLINHYNKKHTNGEFYLHAQDKKYTPKQKLKENIDSCPKKINPVRREKHSSVLKQQSNESFQDRLRQRFLRELPQQVNSQMDFPQHDSFQTNNYIFFPDLSASIHNSNYLEWTEK